MTEKKLQNEILKIIGSNPAFRLFRNHVGNGYTGYMASKFENGNITLANARRCTFGLCPGSADLIGLQSIEITPDMVGQKIARFVSIEVKSEKGELKKEQEAWQKMVAKLGGVAITAKSIEDVERML